MILPRMMHIDDFMEMIRKKEIREDLIVRLAYKYEPTDEYTISNEVLSWEFDLDGYVWLNDWWEGEEYVGVIAYTKVDDVTF